MRTRCQVRGDCTAFQIIAWRRAA